MCESRRSLRLAHPETVTGGRKAAAAGAALRLPLQPGSRSGSVPGWLARLGLGQVAAIESTRPHCHTGPDRDTARSLSERRRVGAAPLATWNGVGLGGSRVKGGIRLGLSRRGGPAFLSPAAGTPWPFTEVTVVLRPVTYASPGALAQTLILLVLAAAPAAAARGTCCYGSTWQLDRRCCARRPARPGRRHQQTGNYI